MGTHPNVILLLALTPDDLPLKTMRSILAEFDVKDDNDIEIGSNKYHHKIMYDDYDEGWQISAKEGDLIFFDLVTYGYGDTITWADLETRKQELERWATDVCKKHNCTFIINVTANYW